MSNGREIDFEFEQEEDGRWIAELPGIPGALCYGATPKEAAVKLVALVIRILEDRIEHIPNAETIAAFEEFERAGGKSFNSVEELMADLNSADEED